METLKCSHKSCNYSSLKIEELLMHIFISHSKTSEVKFMCFIKNCKLEYKNFKQFSKHVTSKHDSPKKENLFFQCEICNRKWIQSIKDLIKHWYLHAEKKTNIHCIFEKCDYVGNNKNGYVSHLAKYHPKKCSTLVRKNLKIWEPNVVFDDEQDACEQDKNDEQNVSISYFNESDNRIEPETIEIVENNYSFNKPNEIYEFYIKAFLKYNDKYLIPEYMCREIFDDVYYSPYK
ncbi:unnamed protein product [Brachionus calyciflorus]|uniref:C2H2-type domain-containing protein n=1 Tax=Brachionus calyciflorus TaxID=104777 RepID=A0A813UH61_9BILA|nr:unnamed protein product [Brachionus calyciflorus]